MPKIRKEYSEIDDIRKDIDSLKSNVIELTKHIGHNGEAKTEEIKEMASEKIKAMSNISKQKYGQIEDHIKEKPGQSVAIAFATGVVLSALMRR